jgi:hypothetical protein
MLDDHVPYPEVDFDALPNPVPAIMAAPEFERTYRFFLESPVRERALVTTWGHAILHALIRNQRPAHVVEIGSYRGGTTEIMARAVLANGGGMVHTIGPFDSERFLPVYEQWPPEVRQAVRFYPMDSMAFYMQMGGQGLRPDLVFIDGNHDYEFALFDILCAARRLSPRGFIVIDDASQAGPYFAAIDFMASHPDWIACAGPSPLQHDRTKAFDWDRAHVRGADFMILRAPAHERLFDDRPKTLGEAAWKKPEARGLGLTLDGQQGPGTLHVQFILRGMADGQNPVQAVDTVARTIQPGMRDVVVLLDQPIALASPHDQRTLEISLVWIGQGALCLSRPPKAF